MRRPAQLLPLLLLALALLAPASATAGVPLPKSIAAVGDSMTRAAGTCFIPWTDCPANSWSTGTNTTVDSHYLRLLDLTPKIKGHNYNDARSGARMGELSTQLDNAIAQAADYITVEFGGNDVCTSNLASMTPVDTYRAQFRDGLDRVARAMPNVRVFTASVPNIYKLWEIYHTDLLAQIAWGTLGVCQSLLANPTSTATADVERRQAFLDRIVAYNNALAGICAAYRQCRFDGFTAFNADLQKSDVVHTDYFHPSTSGQARFAAGTWSASYWAP
jgi:lysophospholipase L1-like esterase